MENLAVEVTQDSKKKPMVLIRVVKDHDLVLEFSYAAERKKFLGKLENFLQVLDHPMPSLVVRSMRWLAPPQ